MQDVKIDLIEVVQESSTVDKKKKDIVVVGPTPYGLYKVKFEGGGELPDALKNSQWSTKKDAEFFAKEYNRSK